MSDRTYHPDVDPTHTWMTWGEAMEHTPGMLDGILREMPAPQHDQDARVCVLAIALWLQLCHHRNVSVHQSPAPHGLENHSAGASPLCVVAIGQYAFASDAPTCNDTASLHDDLVCFPSDPTLPLKEVARWPHIPQDELARLIEQSDLEPWLERIHQAEQRWLERHPEQLVAQITLTGDLKEDDQGELILIQAIVEGIEGVLKFDVRQRDMASERNAWVNRAVHGKTNEVPHPRTRDLMATLLPPELANDPNFEEAAVVITYHRPSAAKLARIVHSQLQQGTTGAGATSKTPRL